MSSINKISIIIPVYNEEKTIETVIDKVFSAKVFNLEKEIIVIDDYSSDNSRQVLEKIQGKYNLIINKHEKNMGKGAALRTGFSCASGDIVLVQDADLEYSPDEYEKVIGPFFKHQADVVYGSRFSGGEAHRVLYFWHYIGNKFLTLLSNMFTNLNLTDMETCYKAFKKDIIDNVKIQQNRFGFEPEITAKISRIKDIKIFEVGISYSGRSYAEGKKIGWKDGINAIYCIFKYGFKK
ncbi:glycosyltransferase family 2 protein [Candidatus Margulisiibacteriota bacterium]